VGRYRVLIKPSARKELLAIPTKKDRQRLVRRIELLGEEPRPAGCQKLAGGGDRFRVRQGQYRIVYEIRTEELVVLVVKLGHRRDVYRAL
jgi:mRNA interferase RelE/StbE